MLSRLEISRLKSIRHFSFDLAPLVLLTGLNSSGKSTMLQGLRMLFNCIHQKPISLEGHGTFKDLFFSSSLDEGEDKAPDGIFLAVHSSESKSASFTWRKEHIEVAPQAQLLDNYNFHVLSADRQGPVPFFTKHAMKGSEGGYFPGAKGEYVYACLQLFGDDQLPATLWHPSNPGHTLRHNVNAWLSEVVAEASIALEQTPDSLDVASITFDGYRQVNVGFGESYTLSVVVALLAASAWIHNHSEHKCKNVVLAIENPEAHLHARGQTVMGKLLALVAKSGVQIIVETHSEYIIDGVRLAIKEKLGDIECDDAVLYFFEKRLAASIIEKITFDKAGRLSSWLPGFFDQSRKNKAKLLG